jgi:Flp pilus assembly pilin Flp
MKKYIFSEQGQGLVEYGLLISLVAIMAIGSLTVFGIGLGDKYGALTGAIAVTEQEDGSYVITTEDGVYVLSALGRLQGPYTGDETDISIPNTLGGFSIKEIYQDVFRNKGLTEVVFGEGSGITRIHARAFLDNELSSIVFPSNLTRIDLWAFRGNNLTSVNFPNTLTTIEGKAFDGNNITRITIGSNVTSIGSGAFSNNNEGFKSAYAAGGAGTYVYTNGNWIKQ